MKTIRIVSGVFGYQVEGRIKPVKAGDSPVTVKAEVAERLVKHGFAIYVPDNGVATDPDGGKSNAEVNTPPAENKPPNGENNADGENISPVKPEYDMDTHFDVLKAILKDCEIPFRVGMSKEEIIEILDEYFNDEGEDGEGFPDLEGQGVVP